MIITITTKSKELLLTTQDNIYYNNIINQKVIQVMFKIIIAIL